MKFRRTNKQGAEWYVTLMDDKSIKVWDKGLQWLYIFPLEEKITDKNERVIAFAQWIKSTPDLCAKELLFLRTQRSHRRLKRDIKDFKNMERIMWYREDTMNIHRFDPDDDEREEQDIETEEDRIFIAKQKVLEEFLIQKYAPVLERLSKE